MERQQINLPYGDVVKRLVTSVFSATAELCRKPSTQDREINKHFLWLGDEILRGKDPHLFLSPSSDKSLRTQAENIPHATRIGSLVRRAFLKAENVSVSSRKPGKFLVSPLKVVSDYLTVPDEPASRAYAFTTLRAFLFEELHVCPEGQSFPQGFLSFSYQDIEEAVASMKTYTGGRDNVKLVDLPARLLVYHLLAMRGLLVLRFGTLKDGTREPPGKARLFYCDNAKVAPTDGYEFRRSDEVARYPETAEIINELWGVPLPIRGADTVFFSGLKFQSDGGLVLSISGRPGTGKTSVALAFAAALAPMGTHTYYVSAEESEHDVVGRLTTLIPEFLRDLSAFRKDSADWFRAKYFPPVDFESSEPSAPTPPDEILNKVREFTADYPSTTIEGFPIPCPLIVVLDGVHHFLQASPDQRNSRDTIPRLIASCRNLGALVILTVADERDGRAQLDYLVDAQISLNYQHTAEVREKPSRVLVLEKTRHQLSRPGSHICHISGTEGFRLSPQLPSQLDRRSFMKFGLPDETRKIDVLNRPVPVSALVGIDHTREIQPFECDHDEYLDVYFRSHILVHGKGSSGKAGFALKLLLAPIQAVQKARGALVPEPARVLIASFLYPERYYFTLRDRLRKLMRYEYRSLKAVARANVEVLHFYPGYLNPEDFFAKVDKKLDEADLEGRPFTGVLLDGLHNVFLQFPRLSENPMIWPMLYGMLRRRDVTLVTTHTTFSLSDSEHGHDVELEVKQAQPLMHALVQAADFFFDIDTVRSDSTDRSAEFEISTRTAISQTMPSNRLFWHREKLVIYAQRQGDLFSRRKTPFSREPDK